MIEALESPLGRYGRAAAVVLFVVVLLAWPVGAAVGVGASAGPTPGAGLGTYDVTGTTDGTPTAGGTLTADGTPTIGGTPVDGTPTADGTLTVEPPDGDAVDGDGRTGEAETDDGDDVYGSVDAAAAAAPPGGRVEVTPGEYRENVTVGTARLTVVGVGDGPVVVNGTGLGPGSVGVFVAAGTPRVTVADLQVRGHEEGLTVLAESATVEDVTVSDLPATGGEAVQVVGANATLHGLTVRDAPGRDGVFLGAANATVEDLSVAVGRDAVVVEAPNVTVDGLSVAGGDDGLVAGPSASGLRVRDVLVRSVAGDGLRVESRAGAAPTEDLVVRNVTVRNATVGVSLHGVNRTDLLDVTVRNAGEAGVALRAGSRGTPTGRVSVRDGRFRTNGDGILVGAAVNASRVRVRESAFLNNTVFGPRPGEFTGYGIRNRNGSATVDARRNYWGGEDGPSSPPGPALGDPEDGDAVADGAGDAVSEGATEGVANVRFWPFLDADPTGGALVRFDADLDGRIEAREVLDAVAAYNAGTEVGGESVTARDVLDAIAAYNAGTEL